MRMLALRMTCAACGALPLAQTRCPASSPNLVQGEESVEVGVREASGAFALHLASTTARGCPESPYQTKPTHLRASLLFQSARRLRAMNAEGEAVTLRR